MRHGASRIIANVEEIWSLPSVQRAYRKGRHLVNFDEVPSFRHYHNPCQDSIFPHSKDIAMSGDKSSRDSPYGWNARALGGNR